MTRAVEMLRAMWHCRAVYGWRNRFDRVERAAMLADWRRR